VPDSATTSAKVPPPVPAACCRTRITIQGAPPQFHCGCAVKPHNPAR